MSKVLVHLPDTSEAGPKYVGAGWEEMSLRMQNDLERFKVFVEL